MPGFCPSYLILMLTRRCNMSCPYCYLGENRHSPGAGPEADMPGAVIDRAVSLVSGAKEKIHVQISGGEPFLVPELVEHAAAKVRSDLPEATIGIQTNASLINADAVDLIRRFDIQAGVSLDGEPLIQEQARGCSQAVFKGICMLENSGIDFTVTTVVTAFNVTALHRLVLLLSGFSCALGIGLDPVVMKGDAVRNGICAPDKDMMAKGIELMMKTLDRVNAVRKRPLVIREMQRLKHGRNLKPGQGRKSFCHAARGTSLAVTPDADMYPCTQTAFDPDFFLGSLNGFHDRILASEPLIRSMCLECEMDDDCPGECPGRLHYNRKTYPEIGCAMYRALNTGTGTTNQYCPVLKENFI